MKLENLQLKPREERRLLGGHLWIYSNEIDISQTPLKNFPAGEQVRVINADGKSLGIAYVNPGSLICARLISRNGQILDHQLLRHRIVQALRLRERLFNQPYYRLVYGESDLLPGLVVDRFGAHLSVQLNTAGMDRLRNEIIDVLKELFTPESILFRNDSAMRPLENLPLEVTAVHGIVPETATIEENGVTMSVPLLSGQKTGWFYDQRNNRARLRTYVKEKTVLDVFSYIGSFAVQAAAFGASHVTAVDGSSPALIMAGQNARQNGVGGIFQTIHGDAFEVLKNLYDNGLRYDVVIVDPPAFIKRKKDHKEGLKAYHRINELAIRLLKPDALLLSASCSMHLHRDELLQVLRSSGRKQGRHLQILEEGGQGPDHPVHPAIPETLYLKAFIARVCEE